jgi:hypothetical protein
MRAAIIQGRKPARPGRAGIKRDELEGRGESLAIYRVANPKRLRQIGLNPGTGRYENSSQFAAALQKIGAAPISFWRCISAASGMERLSAKNSARYSSRY